MKVKIIVNEICLEGLENDINEFLETVEGLDVKVSIKNGDYMAVIMYKERDLKF